eukprot:gene7520-11844_t
MSETNNEETKKETKEEPQTETEKPKETKEEDYDKTKKFKHPTLGLVDRGDIPVVPKKEHTAPDGKKFCSFGVSNCTQRPMKGYEFCVKHILQDIDAPFKQCDFISKQSKKRCTNPVNLNQEDIRYCNSHKQMLGIIPKNTGTQKKKRKNDDGTNGTSSNKRQKKEENSDSDTDNEENEVGKRRRRYLHDSDTESDVPSSDEEYIESTPYLHKFKKVENLSEEEFLEMRKERIENLLRIYYNQYKNIKFNLQNKYLDFIKQKEKFINSSLNVPDGTFKVDFDIKKYEPIQMNEDTVSYSTQCIRVPKIDSAGVSLCDYSNCNEKRLLSSDFCFNHILFDPKQVLYTKGTNGIENPQHQKQK